MILVRQIKHLAGGAGAEKAKTETYFIRAGSWIRRFEKKDVADLIINRTFWEFIIFQTGEMVRALVGKLEELLLGVHRVCQLDRWGNCSNCNEI
jgi:hypothetical protein